MTKRVIPWALPSIKGGSVGGYTPAPTPPTPPEPEGPYNFDDMVVSVTAESRSFKASGIMNSYPIYFSSQAVSNAGTFPPSISISGVKINDSSSVSSVKLFLTIPSDGYVIDVPSATMLGAAVDVNLVFDISAICTPIGGVAAYDLDKVSTGLKYSLSADKNATCTISEYSITKIQVYNSNGIVIQEWTPPEDEE